MIVNRPGISFPVNVTKPAMWAAFTRVCDAPWSLRLSGPEPLLVQVERGPELDLFLLGSTSRRWDEIATGIVAERLLEITSGFSERTLTLRGRSIQKIFACETAREAAVAELKQLAIRTLRNDLNDAQDRSPEKWFERIKAALDNVPEAERGPLSSHTGLDQFVTLKELRAGLNYVFQTLEPSLTLTADGVCIIGDPRRLREIREARHDSDGKARARNLVLRAAEARLKTHPPSMASPTLDLEELEQDLRERAASSGCWGLIDLTLKADRMASGGVGPSGLPAEVQNLLDQQDHRLAGI